MYYGFCSVNFQYLDVFHFLHCFILHYRKLMILIDVITSDPIFFFDLVYFHILIRILTFLSVLYMMKAVPTGCCFHQLRIILSFQLYCFCVQWNLLLSLSWATILFTSIDDLARKLSWNTSLLSERSFVIIPTDGTSNLDRYPYRIATDSGFLWNDFTNSVSLHLLFSEILSRQISLLLLLF